MSTPAPITTQRMADAIGWSISTVRRAAARGKLGTPSRTPGGDQRPGEWRWSPEDAVAVLRAQGRAAPEAWAERAA